MSAYGNLLFEMASEYFADKSFGALLVDAMYEQDINVDTVVSDVVAHELTVSGYSRQSVTVTVTYDSDLAAVLLTCDDVDFGTWATDVEGDAAPLGPVFFIDTGDDATSKLLNADVGNGAVDIDAGVPYVYKVAIDGGIWALQVADALVTG